MTRNPSVQGPFPIKILALWTSEQRRLAFSSLLAVSPSCCQGPFSLPWETCYELSQTATALGSGRMDWQGIGYSQEQKDIKLNSASVRKLVLSLLREFVNIKCKCVCVHVCLCRHIYYM